jgi:nitrogen permease regulator 2-like protein
VSGQFLSLRCTIKYSHSTDESNTINLKLFHTRPPPAPVHAWHVPLLTINLSAFSSHHVSSDLTLQRILPHINGVNSVSRISYLADTDPGLTRKGIQHLLYYGCVLLLDVFQFSAIYAPTASISNFILNTALQQECAKYVRLPALPLPTQSTVQITDKPMDSTIMSGPQEIGATEFSISATTLVKLFTALRQGTTLRSWCSEHMELLKGIDIRRLITFGIIKGLIYRVHKYIISNPSPVVAQESEGQQRPRNGKDLAHQPEQSTNSEEQLIRMDKIEAKQIDDNVALEKFIEGVHSFDEICTEFKQSDKDIAIQTKQLDHAHLFYR